MLSWKRRRAGRAGRRRRWSWLPRAGAALALGYALAGFFLVPAFLERNEINLKIYTEPTWTTTSTLSTAAIDLVAVGIRHEPGGVERSDVVPYGPVPDRRRDRRAGGRGRAAAPRAGLARATLFYAGVTLLVVFMMMPASAFIWDALPPLKFVQFPGGS